MVKIVIGNIFTKVVGFLPDVVHSDLTLALSYRVQGCQYSPKYKNNKWDGYIRLYDRHKGQSFYTGLLGFVREILKKHNIAYELVDRRIRPQQNLPDLKFIPPPSFEKREYQDFTIDRAIKFTRGVLCVCTGGGKTIMVAQIISQIKTYPFMFYVLSRDLMIQAHNVLSTCLNEPIGMIGDGVVDVKRINVCTIQTAIIALRSGQTDFKISDYQFDEEDVWDEKRVESKEKIEEVKNVIRNAAGVYLDECHHASCTTARTILTASTNAFWRYGGSATPYREAGDEIYIQAMFGGKIVDINASYLIKKRYLVKPYIFFVPTEMKTNYHTYSRIYKECITGNTDLNNSVAKIAKHFILRKMTVLILVKQIAHGNNIKNLIPGSEFMEGKMASNKRTDILDRLRKKEIMVVIATSLADEGLDVPTLDAVIDAGGSASATRVNQRIGRALRTSKGGKSRSVIVLFDHEAKYLTKHSSKVKRILQGEPEFVIRISKGPDFICDEIDSVLGIDSHSPTLFDV
jgi:superfamily II DNA or RNA helicase